MSPSFRPTALALSLAVAFPLHALAQADTSTAPAREARDALEVLPPVVITAPIMQTPLVTQFNPRDPQQPLPANDGASLLKTIPGMSVIRKGGTDGDPVFRGMAASRLNILIDGEQILGGCGMRMDPPTAYVFPEAFDRIVISACGTSWHSALIGEYMLEEICRLPVGRRPVAHTATHHTRKNKTHEGAHA